MKWKVIIALFVVAVGGLLFIVWHYGFDWSVLADLSFYEDLANPSIRIVKVPEGLRKEQVAQVVGDKLGWDTTEKTQFENVTLAFSDTNVEGYLFPKTYMILKDSTPQVVSKTMQDTFKKETATIAKSNQTKVVSQDIAIKIASIIQRESGGKSDMRLISGIIWNRLFSGMKLQMDATVQYAVGTSTDWWPQIDPKDISVDSPYNTYKYPSLPPSPIASPGLSAIEAAYNPQKTNCLFYLHDKKGKIHCSITYQGQLNNIARYY